jgi:hypothetical protein
MNTLNKIIWLFLLIEKWVELFFEGKSGWNLQQAQYAIYEISVIHGVHEEAI